MMNKIKFFLSFIFLLFALFAFAQTNPNHVYVKPYIKSDGTYVKGHYRTKANETNRDNFSTKGNVNPYTGQSGWITPDNNHSPSYSRGYSEKAFDALKAEDYNTALQYADMTDDELMSNIIRFRVYHAKADFHKALHYAKKARQQANDPAHIKSMNQWIDDLTQMATSMDELELRSIKYEAAIEAQDYTEAIFQAVSIQSPLLQKIKYLYLGNAYELNHQYENALINFNKALESESIPEYKEGLKYRIKNCKAKIKYPKLNQNLQKEDIAKILILHTQNAYSELDVFLREFGYTVSESTLKEIKLAYQRTSSDPERFEVLFLLEKKFEDSTTLKVITLEHNSIEYYREFKESFKYYKYRKENTKGFNKNFIGNEYAYEYYFLFEGFRTNSSEAFIIAGQLFLNKDDHIIPLNLSLYEPAKN